MEKQIRNVLLSAALGVIVVFPDGHVQVFSEQEALARAGEPSFAQALGHPLPTHHLSYRQIWQHRDGNTTVDAAIERIELGR